MPDSPESQATSEPHMPDVEVPADLDAVFAKAREDAANEARRLVVITPARMRITVPAAGNFSPDLVNAARSILGNTPLNVSVVAFTKGQGAAMDHEARLRSMNEAIPFFGHLIGLAHVGHSVVVFEGHPSAFEAGVRGANALIIDEAMLPFLQEDWAPVAFRAMSPSARIFIHSRESYSLLPVKKAKNPEGWDYAEPDGEPSYVNCLLTTMAKAPKKQVRIVAGAPLPDLAQIATDPGALEWISSLPFRYDQLDAEQVMEILVKLSKWVGLFKRSMVLTATLVVGDGARTVSFKLVPGRSKDGRQQLVIESA